MVNGTFYIFVSGMLDYGPEHVGVSRTTMLLCVMAAGSAQVVTIPLLGALSDRAGRRTQHLFGTVLMAVFAFPMFWLIDTGSVPVIFLAPVAGLTIHATMHGPRAALYSERFPADVRCSGASLGYQLASVFAGGLAPFMTALLAATGASWSAAAYIVVMAVLTFVAVVTSRESFRRDLHETSEKPALQRVPASRPPVTAVEQSGVGGVREERRHSPPPSTLRTAPVM